MTQQVDTVICTFTSKERKSSFPYGHPKQTEIPLFGSFYLFAQNVFTVHVDNKKINMLFLLL